jgi:large subunit ribosomal protein L22
MQKKIITVQLREQRVSPKKARLVMSMVKGMPLDSAMAVLSNTNKKSALTALSLLKSAAAAAKDKDYQADKVIICESLVNEGRKLKRYFIRARGRSTKFLKRSSHFKISLCAREDQEPKKKTKGKKNGKQS